METHLENCFGVSVPLKTGKVKTWKTWGTAGLMCTQNTKGFRKCWRGARQLLKLA